MNVGVIGGSGFIGSHVVDKLIKNGHKVTVFDIMKPHRDDVIHKNIDITDATNTSVALAGNYDAIYLLAAMADVNDCYKNPVATIEVNVMGVANVLEACVKHEISRFIFASTVWTYGLSDDQEVNENTSINITNKELVSVVYDAVGKDTFETSLKCLNFRGLMVSFGQSSGMVKDVNLHSTFNPKSLYYTRPTLMHYIRNKKELDISSKKLFDKIKNKEIKPNIFKAFKLSEASEAHKLIESRKSIGSIILNP